MSAFLNALNNGATPIDPKDLAIHLCMALLLGAVIAGLYVTTRHEHVPPSFPTTLVLLTILIAMVTQVIGDSVARAFSLVGALSIVRFRTVVRDTEDTAYVIFAVVTGMAMGANRLWVACIGIVVIGVAAFVLKSFKKKPSTESTHLLTVRVGIGHDVNTIIKDTLSEYATAWRIQSASTSKQGLSVDVTFGISLRSPEQIEAFVKALNHLEGVQSVQLMQHDFRE
jgi:uncharacterized membrane protein YhiD involved in acid resistance